MMGKMQEVSDKRNRELVRLYTQTPTLTLDQIGEAMGYEPGPNRSRVVTKALRRLRQKGWDIPRRNEY